MASTVFFSCKAVMPLIRKDLQGVILSCINFHLCVIARIYFKKPNPSEIYTYILFSRLSETKDRVRFQSDILFLSFKVAGSFLFIFQHTHTHRHALAVEMRLFPIKSIAGRASSEAWRFGTETLLTLNYNAKTFYRKPKIFF